MRLVQQVMLPESRQIHLAEIFLSGLIKRSIPVKKDSKLILYDFYEGVRDILLNSVLIPDALQIIEEVSQYLSKKLGQGLDFQACLADPTAIDGIMLDEKSLSFGKIKDKVLSRIGGNYAQLAKSSEQETSEGISPYSLWNITIENKQKLTDKLLACPTVKDSNSLKTLLRQLPENIYGAIHNVTHIESHVYNIVETCLKHIGGMEYFIDIITDFEDNSEQAQNLTSFLQQRVPRPVTGGQLAHLKLIFSKLYDLPSESKLKELCRACLPESVPLPTNCCGRSLLTCLLDFLAQQSFSDKISITEFINRVIPFIKDPDIYEKLNKWVNDVSIYFRKSKPKESEDISPKLGSFDLLLIDDSQSWLDIFYKIFDEIYFFDTARSYGEAIQKIKNNNYKIICTEYFVPTTYDGYKLLRFLNNKYPEISVVLITGYPAIKLENIQPRYPIIKGIVYKGTKNFTKNLKNIVPSLIEEKERKRGKILVVDNSKNWRELFVDILREDGYQIETASNFKDAVELLKTESFDMAIIEIQLNEEVPFNRDGLKVLKEAKTLHPLIKSIILTGYPDESEKDRMLNFYKADGYYEKAPDGKPFDIDEFRQIIFNLLNKKDCYDLLIIEDSDNWRKLIVDICSEEGYKCDTAMDYNEAIKKINNHKYKIICTDLNVNSLKMLSFLKMKYSKIPVVLITASGNVEKNMSNIIKKYPNIKNILIKGKSDNFIKDLKHTISSCMKIDIFVSYASEDYHTAKRLYDDLKREGITAWLDREDLLAGQNWRETIPNIIRESSYFLLLISKNSVSKKGFVQKEQKIALELLDEFPSDGIFIIPARIDNTEPVYEKLRNLHWADLSDYGKGFQQILKTLKNENLS